MNATTSSTPPTATGAGARTSLRQAEEEEPLLQFPVLRSLRYGTRYQLAIGAAALGLVLQIAFLSVWPGLPLLVVALLLSWVSGFDNKVDFRGFQRTGHWERVPLDRLREILQVDRRMKKWDESALDASSLAGGALFVLAFVVIGIVTVVLLQTSIDVAVIFAVDAVLLVVFQWLNGMRRIQRQPDLLLKADHLLKTAAAAGLDDPTDHEVGAQLLMAGDGEDRLPMGAKLTVTWPDGPRHFYGVQCQVVINRVQGKPYPYCYSVLVGEEGHDLIEHTDDMHLPANVLRTTQRDDGVEVVVVRQRTTKKSGYHTKVPQSAAILAAAVEAADGFVRGGES